MSSTARAGQSQLKLLDIPPNGQIKSNAHARNVYGNLMAEFACHALGLSPIRINGNFTHCFNAEKYGMFYEIKSVHRTGKIVVYDWRMKKEEQYSDRLSYLLCIHDVRGCRSYSELLSKMNSVALIQIPFPLLRDQAMKCPLNKLGNSNGDPRNGYARKGYIDGYRNVPLGWIKEYSAMEWGFRTVHFYTKAINCSMIRLIDGPPIKV